MQTKKKASAPRYHTSGTRYVAASKEAASIIPFEGKRPTAQEQLERSQFKAGVMVGFLAALMIFLAVLWLWVIPHDGPGRCRRPASRGQHGGA